MKRIIGLILLFLTTFPNISSQKIPIGKYEIYLDGWIRGDSNHHCGEAYVEVTINNGVRDSTYKVFNAQYSEYSPKEYFDRNKTITYFTANNKIKKFYFYASRRIKSSCRGKRPNNYGSIIDGIGINLNAPCFSRYFKYDNDSTGQPTGFVNDHGSDGSGLWHSELTLFVKPRLVIINSLDTRNILPADDSISIDSHYGFKSDEYNWQYSFDNVLWQDLPLFKGLSSINISGKSILGRKVDSLIGKNILFRQVACNEDIKSNTVTYTILPSAPQIDSVTYQMPTCHSGNDAKLFIHFNRKLYENEKLYVSTKGNRFTIPSTFTADSKVMEIPNLVADTFNITLHGTYKFGANLSDTINTYTGGAKHKYSIRIPERPALNIDQISQNAVHCYGGRDGKIILKANGGVGIFDAFLKEGTTLVDSIRFASAEQGIFKNVKAGVYTVSLRDTNGCRWDVGGNEVTKQIEVTQPSQKVSIVDHHSLEPTGFRMSNGSAQVTFVGGTSGNYTVVWKDSLGNVIPNTIVQDGDTYISKVNNIKSSFYHISVFDANYSSANPQTIDNLCGCTDTISFLVTEPPKLEVTVAEHHYVTCNGDNDGAIVAHAKGGRPLLSSLPYTYQWMKVEGSNITSISQTDSIITGLVAGYYRVKISDRNNIETTSIDYHLEEPEPLAVTTKVLQNIRCSGDSIGIIQAIASGGTPPYTYLWSTNDTTAILKGLPEGKYVVGVQDARYRENVTGHYCFAQTYDSIISPNPIKLNAIVKNPVCHGYSNGEIILDITGGTPPYSILWNDGSDVSKKTNLTQGDYHVKVTDANGCFGEKLYSLKEPEEIVVNLGKDIILCKDQTITLNGDIGLPNISYQWTDKKYNILANTSSYPVNKAGTYRLTATTPQGCSGSDEINIDISNDEVVADFIVASQVANNTKTYAVNISQSIVDSINWLVPAEAVVWEKGNDRIQIGFPNNGQYIVGMTLYKNRCSNTLYKTIQVVNEGDITEEPSQEPFLKKFIVTPNPNDGTFQAIVELREPADYSLSLYDSSGKLVTSQNIKNKIAETTNFKVIKTGNGVFYLKFISNKGISVFNVLIK